MEQNREPMVLLTLRIETSQDNREEALQVLRGIRGPISVMPGFLDFYCGQSIDNPNGFFLIEKWESLSRLNKYITSEDFGDTLALIDLSKSDPEFDIHTVSHTAAMEALVLLRRKGGLR